MESIVAVDSKVVKEHIDSGKIINITKQKLDDWETYYNNKWKSCMANPKDNTVAFNMDNGETICFRIVNEVVDKLPF